MLDEKSDEMLRFFPQGAENAEKGEQFNICSKTFPKKKRVGVFNLGKAWFLWRNCEVS